MAKQKDNVVTHGLSGTIGGMLVFHQRAGQTVVAKTPTVSNVETEAQRAHRRRFQHAVLYSGGAAAAKAKRGQTARNVAVADFLRAPDIELIDLTGYHGKAGDTVRIEATDDFAVREVKVVISNADGSPVEEGYAKQEPTGYEWIYTATAGNDTLEGDRIEVYASDTPGNISKAE
jgi:hypothetical protein